MANPYKEAFLSELERRFGRLDSVSNGRSLYAISGTSSRIYVRYSKRHDAGRTFFGLREADLRQLEGYDSYLCFLVDDNSPPVLIPFADFEEIFRSAQPAQLFRPTFITSGLAERTSFIQYGNVFDWHSRLADRKL